MTGNINSAQDLLEHSDKKTTETWYTDEMLLLKWRVNKLPVKEWIT
jgi:hypothetical protein